MPVIFLKQPTYVDDVLRHPIEGGIVTSEDEATRLETNNLLAEPDDEEVDENDDLDGKSAVQLRAIAKADEIDLRGATKPADMIQVIRLARKPADA